MLDGGEDPLYIARRLIRMAVEDIGMADPRALAVAIAAKDGYHFLGSPEGDLALAQAVVYLATAPKSNRIYRAFGAAMQQARETPAEPVPLHLRNAPTRLMKELGYGEGYRYSHDESDAEQEYLPEQVHNRAFYQPSSAGYEERVARRLRRGRRSGAEDESRRDDPAG
jgi:putative ATPase